MKINNKILSVPPYLSTTWNNIRSLYLEDSTLIVSLSSGEIIKIPNLNPTELNEIFNTHANYLDQQNNKSGQHRVSFPISHPIFTEGQAELPFRMTIGAIDDLGAVMQHNPSQADSPEIPAEILEKIIMITKMLAPGDNLMLSQPEEGCNCMHCQLARVTNQAASEATPKEIKHEEEEQVADVELQFQQWDIVQTGDKLYNVTNRLDRNEHYSVFLGEPVGCTCGKNGCEHIVAVLKS